MENKDKKQEIVKKELQDSAYVALTNYDNKIIGNRLKAIDSIGETIKQALVEGVANDYAVIPGTSKPSLLQPGARKIAWMYGLLAEYKDMVNNNGVIIIKCELFLQNGKKISECYGAAALQKFKEPGWALNAAIKIAEKRAFVGAILGVANLSKVFTQDTEDMQTQPQHDKKTNIKVDYESWGKNK